jgi:hypothetical protein
VLTGIDEIETRHLPHHEKDVFDADSSCFLNGLGQTQSELALLLLSSSIADIACDDRHFFLLVLPMVLVGFCALLRAEACQRANLQRDETLFAGQFSGR